MFSPMYDPQVSVAGIPGAVVLVAIGAVLLVGGLLWIRRITAGDPDIKSFWATDRGGLRWNAPLKAGLALAAVAVALVVLVRF